MNHAKCEDGSVVPLVKSTPKDESEQAQIIKLWVAGELRELANIAAI